MKKLFVIFICSLVLSGCSEDSNPLSPSGQKHFRQIAYNYLSDDAKATIINWQNGKVEDGTYHSSDEYDFIVLDSKNEIPFAANSSDVKLYTGQRLVAVTFETTMDPLLGPLILIVEPRSDKVIGYVLRM